VDPCCEVSVNKFGQAQKWEYTEREQDAIGRRLESDAGNKMQQMVQSPNHENLRGPQRVEDGRD
jgi:hypothetical protein